MCGCYRGGWKCDQTCLEDALISESLFYPIGTVCYFFFLFLLVSIINIIRFLVFVQQPFLHLVSTSLRWLSNVAILKIFLFSPNSNIWMVGHSLGGALASLVGITFGLPTVTFESPGERLAATRLHLPSPVSVLLPFLKLLSDHHISSPLPTTSRISITQQTPSRWVHATVFSLHVHWVDTRWRQRQFSAFRS